MELKIAISVNPTITIAPMAMNMEDGSYIFVITADEDAAMKSSGGEMKSSDEIFWTCISTWN